MNCTIYHHLPPHSHMLQTHPPSPPHFPVPTSPRYPLQLPGSPCAYLQPTTHSSPCYPIYPNTGSKLPVYLLASFLIRPVPHADIALTGYYIYQNMNRRASGPVSFLSIFPISINNIHSKNEKYRNAIFSAQSSLQISTPPICSSPTHPHRISFHTPHISHRARAFVIKIMMISCPLRWWYSF